METNENLDLRYECSQNGGQAQPKLNSNRKTDSFFFCLVLVIRFFFSYAAKRCILGTDMALPDCRVVAAYNATYTLYLCAANVLMSRFMQSKQTTAHKTHMQRGQTQQVCLHVFKLRRSSGKFKVCKTHESIVIIANLLFINVCAIGTFVSHQQFPHFT